MDIGVYIYLGGKNPEEKAVLVDRESYHLAVTYRWYLSDCGYAYKSVNGENLFLHRLLMDPPPGKEVDHRNGVPLDCRRENLRPATKQQNHKNMGKHRDAIYSRYIGVTRNINRTTWDAALGDNFSTVSAHFHTEEEAALWRDFEVLALRGEFARLNFTREYLATRTKPTPLARPTPERRTEYYGVTWNKRAKKWHAQLRFNGVAHHVGIYDTDLEAARAHDAYRREHNIAPWKANFRGWND